MESYSSRWLHEIETIANKSTAGVANGTSIEFLMNTAEGDHAVEVMFKGSYQFCIEEHSLICLFYLRPQITK